MKTKLFISVISLLLIAGDFLGGCEEEEPKPDYITVNVSTTGSVEYGGVCLDWLEGLTIQIDIIKDGGETVTYFRVTDLNCNFETPTVSFKLYRGQPIVASAFVQGGIQGYEFTPVVNALNWSDVYPLKDFGETYTWETFLHINCTGN
ncbi:MAG: hypothetical protein WBQ32_08110 [Ignavibacteriaceae bacterium]